LNETAKPLEENSKTLEDSILNTTNIRDGYAIVLGVGTGKLAEQ
jgi:hypothetical protein